VDHQGVDEADEYERILKERKMRKQGKEKNTSHYSFFSRFMALHGGGVKIHRHICGECSAFSHGTADNGGGGRRKRLRAACFIQKWKKKSTARMKTAQRALTHWKSHDA
jgi:hypothetical protein